MTSKKRREDLKDYQRRRTERRRARGLTAKTVWIREEDTDAFASAVQMFVDHARLVEGVTGSITLEPSEIKEIVEKNKLPYALEDLLYLVNIQQAVILNPRDEKAIRTRASDILTRYGLSVDLDELL